jgi:Sec-independent protein secretion pathway component TatC
MAARSTNIPTVEADTPPRNGPVGRAVRVLLAVAGIWFTYHVWVQRGFIFTHVDVPLTALVAFSTYTIGGLFGQARRALATLAVVAAVAAGLAIMWEGNLWAPPLSWLVWGLGDGFLAVITITMFVAVFVGTPGCELGVLAEVTPRLRRQTRRFEGVFCLVGLHKLDAWEARQPWRRTAGSAAD